MRKRGYLNYFNNLTASSPDPEDLPPKPVDEKYEHLEADLANVLRQVAEIQAQLRREREAKKP